MFASEASTKFNPLFTVWKIFNPTPWSKNNSTSQIFLTPISIKWPLPYWLLNVLLVVICFWVVASQYFLLRPNSSREGNTIQIVVILKKININDNKKTKLVLALISTPPSSTNMKTRIDYSHWHSCYISNLLSFEVCEAHTLCRFTDVNHDLKFPMQCIRPFPMLVATGSFSP